MTKWEQLFERSRMIALEAHGQQRYGDKPYEHHLQAVVDVLVCFGVKLDENEFAPLLVAAWLHDSLEDTALTQEEIGREFGSEVAELVWRVTDEPGKNRKERKAVTYHKIAGSENAIVLKLADRIANVESSLQNNPNLFKMYKSEQQDFVAHLKPLSKSEISTRMWNYLDELIQRQT